MATKIKTNSIEAQLDFIDNIVAATTGVDLRKKAQDAIDYRTALVGLGVRIAKSVGFDNADNTMIIVRNGKIYSTIH